MDFFAFFLLVAQPFNEASDLDADIPFFAGVFLDASFFVFLDAFFAVAIFIVKEYTAFDYDVTKNIVNKNKKICYKFDL